MLKSRREHDIYAWMIVFHAIKGIPHNLATLDNGWLMMISNIIIKQSSFIFRNMDDMWDIQHVKFKVVWLSLKSVAFTVQTNYLQLLFFLFTDLKPAQKA